MRLLLLFVILTCSARAEFNTESFLEALAMKETGMGWNGQPGPRGELSKWQITAAVWRDENTVLPFSSANDGDLARSVTIQHLARLRALIIAAGEKPTPERLATCWHYGASHRWQSSAWGQEVANLYESLTP